MPVRAVLKCGGSTSFDDKTSNWTLGDGYFTRWSALGDTSTVSLINKTTVNKPWKKWIILLTRYHLKPVPLKHDLRELAFVWLYSTCLDCVLNADPILSQPEWDHLTAYLSINYQFLDIIQQASIPYAVLDTGKVNGMDWTRGLGLRVFESCQEYLREKGRVNAHS